MGRRPLPETAYFRELRRRVPGGDGGTIMLTRLAPIDIPLYHAPSRIISFHFLPRTLTTARLVFPSDVLQLPGSIAGRPARRMPSVAPFDFFSQGSIRSSRGSAAVTTDGTAVAPICPITPNLFPDETLSPPIPPTPFLPEHIFLPLTLNSPRTIFLTSQL